MKRTDTYGYLNASGTTASTITANSIPVYSGMTKWLNPTWQREVFTDEFLGRPAWGCIEWMQWYKALEKAKGKDAANEKWGDAWLDGLSTAGGGKGNILAGSGTSWDSVPVDCRNMDANFKKFLADNDYLYNVVFSGIGGKIGKVISGTENVITSAGNVIGNVAKSVENTSSVTKWLVPAVLIIGTAGLLYVGYKKMKTA